MSIKVMTWVWDNAAKVYSSGALLVLLAMADHADDEGNRIFPSVPNLAQKTHLSDRQVQNILRQLEKDGLISCTGERALGGRADRTVRMYRINLPGEIISPRSARGVKSSTERGEIQYQNGVKPTSPDPSSGSVIDPSKKNSAYGFDEFWKAYPVKKAKEDACRAWKKLNPDTELCARILLDIRRFLDQSQFNPIPYPATYINGKRWQDESPPSRAEPPPIVADTNPRYRTAEETQRYLKGVFADG